MTQPQVRFSTSPDGTRIAFAAWGDGPPLLWVLAWSASIAHQISPWMRAWADRMGAGRRFIIMDRRGCGASQRDVEDFSLDAQIADIVGVMDRAGLEQTDLFTVGDGAGPCLALAARQPERVRRMVLFCPFAAGDVVAADPSLTRLLGTDFRLGIRAWANVIMPSGTPEDLHRYREDLRKDTSAEMWQRHHQFIVSLDVRPELPGVQAPTLVVHRDRALAVPVEAGKSVATMLPDARLMIVEGDSSHPSVGDSAWLDAALEFLDEDRVATPKPETVGPFRTVLFTDLVGHTEMMSRLGDERGREVLREHERITRDLLKEHVGTEVKTMGDGFMASFSSVTKAVECAIDLQRAFASREGEPLSVRVGLNAGEPIEDEGDLFGATVILASRIAARAGGGEILVADTVRGLCSGKGFLFSDRGEFVAKGFEEPMQVYEVRWRDG